MSKFHPRFSKMLKKFRLFFKKPKKCLENNDNNFDVSSSPSMSNKCTMSRRPPKSAHVYFRTEQQQQSKNVEKLASVYHHPDLTAVIEITKNRFYFATLIPGRNQPKGVSNYYIFDIDDELLYYGFYDDFGPLNIACLYKYCNGVNHILKNPDHATKTIVHYTSAIPEKRANATYLAASYMVLHEGRSPEEAYQIVSNKDFPYLKPFQDASAGVSAYTIRLIDCLGALQKASLLGFFDLDDFDLREYEKYEQVKHGDLNWIIPRKLLAFLGPNTERGSSAHYPEKYLNYFMKNEVTAVVRLNQKAYEPFRFKNAGILHYDMYFPDGSVPPEKILKQFLNVAEATKGAMAVHCKAGLGRTGTLIAAYAMKHYQMSAREAIAWLRICRPGSIVGHQQSWLEKMESSLWREGRKYRAQYHGDENLVLHHKSGIYSIAAKVDKKARYKDYLKILKANEEKHLRSGSRTRCSSASRGGEEGCCKKGSSSIKKTNEKEDNGVTQGDMLNKIKAKRDKLNSDTFTMKSAEKSSILSWQD